MVILLYWKLYSTGYLLIAVPWYTFCMFNFWPYLLRLAVAFYFIYPHVQDLMLGVKKVSTAVFACINDYIPQTIAFTLWHSFFVLLGLLILIWPRPIFPLLIALIIISSQLYINFAIQGYAANSMLLFILLLVTLALIIYHSRPQLR